MVLFANSLNELKIAMQGVLILNNTTINSDGSYSLPKGTNKSYFEKKIKRCSFGYRIRRSKRLELIKETDSLEEINRKTLACASIGINPTQERKSAKKKRNKIQIYLLGQERLQILTIQ